MKKNQLLKLLCVSLLTSCSLKVDGVSEEKQSNQQVETTSTSEEISSVETTSDSEILQSSTELSQASSEQEQSVVESEEVSSEIEQSNETSEEVSSSVEVSIDETPYVAPQPKVREDRVISTLPNLPANKIDVAKMKDAKADAVYQEADNYCMKSNDYTLVFVRQDGTYYPQFVSNETKAVLFEILKPVKLYFKSDGQKEANYDSIQITRYGLLAKGKATSTKGSVIEVEDRYYYPDKQEINCAINVQRSLVVKEAAGDTGYTSLFGVDTLDERTNNLEWFVPNQLFGELTNLPESQSYRIFSETVTGLPMGGIRNKESGYCFSISRYQPEIEYKSNSYASINVHSGTTSGGDARSSVEISYPSRSSARRYFKVSKDSQVVYDMTLMAEKTIDFDQAMIDLYSNQFTLQDQRIVNTDIDEVYNVINEDFKKFMLSKTKYGYTSYGLPWRVTIENGKIGPRSYQAGFVGQQIPCAYHMMVYGIRNNDSVSLQNGINIINFWINSAKMMSEQGVPKIWYDGENNWFTGYPTFTRMAVDAMEGVLDTYRLAEAHNIQTENWYEAVKACADWFVREQNSDGSWYRCYNYQGTYYKGNESDIPWNPGDICRSTSKNNSTMPVRFLGKVFEMTNDVKYYNAIVKAGDFIYNNLYPKHKYFGGTCDNPDSLDKEAGVYAMYAYDTLYSLTKDEKWLKALEQATAFTMSSVLVISYKINPSCTDLKAANPVKYGYTDGLSYICCGGTALDNYAAFIYYELFRLYIHSGKKVYYDMAEFIQQNTKSTMDWDGTLDFAYKSLTPEASTINSFGFNSATDDDNVQGVWLPWQSDANAEPIAKMYEAFGSGDVKTYENTPIQELRNTLDSFGIGGHAHKKYN